MALRDLENADADGIDPYLWAQVKQKTLRELRAARREEIREAREGAMVVDGGCTIYQPAFKWLKADW